MSGPAKFICLSVVGLLVLVPLAATLGADDGFKPIFDGRSLKGWDGNPNFWRVENGCIVGETTPDNPTRGNTFIIWRGGQPADFELKVEYRLRNHNSGVQFRSVEAPKQKWVVGGYQSDIEGSGQYTGILYEERGRGILAQRAAVGDDTVVVVIVAVVATVSGHVPVSLAGNNIPLGHTLGKETKPRPRRQLHIVVFPQVGADANLYRLLTGPPVVQILAHVSLLVQLQPRVIKHSGRKQITIEH